MGATEALNTGLCPLQGSLVYLDFRVDGRVEALDLPLSLLQGLLVQLDLDLDGRVEALEPLLNLLDVAVVEDEADRQLEVSLGPDLTELLPQFLRELRDVRGDLDSEFSDDTAGHPLHHLIGSAYRTNDSSHAAAIRRGGRLLLPLHATRPSRRLRRAQTRTLLSARTHRQHRQVNKVSPLPLSQRPPKPLLPTQQGAGPPHRTRLKGEPGDKILDKREPDAGVTTIHPVEGVQVGVGIRVLFKEEPQISPPSSSPRKAPTRSMIAVRPFSL